MKKFFLTAITALFGALALAGASPALAQQGTVWTIQNGTFDDGATFGGTFTYDADANRYTSWNITTTVRTLTGFTYTSAPPGQIASGSANGVYFYYAGAAQRELDVSFASPLTDGGTISFSGGTEFEDDYSLARQITGGSVTAAGAAPEPASWALMIGGFGVIGGAMRVRRRRAEGLLPG